MAATTAGMVAATNELEHKHLALVARIPGYRPPEAAEARILAEVEVIYRQERATREATLPGGATG